MPKPDDDTMMFLDAMRPEDKSGEPIFEVLANEKADVFRVSFARKRLMHGTRECCPVSIRADGLKPGAFMPGTALLLQVLAALRTRRP